MALVACRDQAAKNMRWFLILPRLARAVALGRTYLLPPLSFGGAAMVLPWLRFYIPLMGGFADLSPLPCRSDAALMHGAGAKASATLCSDALPLYDPANTTGIQRSPRQGGGFSCIAT